MPNAMRSSIQTARVARQNMASASERSPVESSQLAPEHGGELEGSSHDVRMGQACRMRELLSEMSQWPQTLEQRIASCEARITRKLKHDERCVRLAEMPGVAPLPVAGSCTARSRAESAAAAITLSSICSLHGSSLPGSRFTS